MRVFVLAFDGASYFNVARFLFARRRKGAKKKNWLARVAPLISRLSKRRGTFKFSRALWAKSNSLASLRLSANKLNPNQAVQNGGFR